MWVIVDCKSGITKLTHTHTQARTPHETPLKELRKIYTNNLIVTTHLMCMVESATASEGIPVGLRYAQVVVVA